MRKSLNRKTKIVIAIVVGIILLITGIIGAIGYAYNHFIYQDSEGLVTIEEKDSGDDSNQDLVDQDLADQEVVTEERFNKTMALVGKDDTASLTDVVLVLNFNSRTNEANIISIPRDTYVVWSDAQKQYLKREWRYTETSKLTEMSSMGGVENIRVTTLDYVENLLGEPIDNYVVIDTNAFKDIVDAIGGVELEVPHRMYYTDYSQGLYIDLQPGLQVLNGEQAEGFVRFRSTYAMGDLDRIEVQKIFLKAFVEEVTKPSIIMKLPQMIDVVFDSVKTDVRINEIPEYLNYLSSFDPSNLKMHTIPGQATRIEGREVYLVDEEGTQQLVNEIFARNTNDSIKE